MIPSMDAMYICHPGDNINELHWIRSCGFMPVVYPSSKGLSNIKTSGEFPELAYVGGSWADDAHARAIRSSWCDLITSVLGQKDTLLLCESDAVPQVLAADLLPVLVQDMQDHTECDVWKLYPSMEVMDDHLADPIKDIKFRECARTPGHSRNNPTAWGTHALVIPDRSRVKIMQLFRDSALPVDVALEWAHGNGMITMREATEQLFIQQKRRPVWESMPRIACLLSSYKRLKELQRQIYCFMDQSYKNFHLFVAVKGVSEHDVVDILMPTFSHFIEAGRLTIRMAPNRNQVSNLIDCVRGLDVSEYDLFAKIDDDDIYARDYLSTLAEFASFLPKGVGSYYQGFGGFFVKDGTFSHSTVRWYSAWGPTLCFPPQCMRTLSAIEKNPSLAAEVCRGARETQFGFAEDLILHILNMKAGAMNRAPYLVSCGKDKQVCVCQDNTSTTRGGYIENDFSEVTKNLNTLKKNDEYVLALDAGREPRICVVRGEVAEIIDRTPHEMYSVLSFENGSHIELEAMDGAIARYEHGPRGLYIRVGEKKSSPARVLSVPEESNDITYKVID